MAANKQIVFESNGAKYTLEFDRDTAQRAERGLGISMSELQSGKTYMVHDLFAAAFLKHHPHAKPSTIDGFFEAISDKAGLYEALVEMYVDAAASLLEEPEEGKAISWKVQ